ncbi:hypothetical protein FRC07_005431 [Ceratobasidium sp. 392]|nr:hypothetical protein FRC07_005431 [Ceratobasidium sp. 392]
MVPRPQKLSPVAVRHAVRLVTQNNCVSAVQPAQVLSKSIGETVHPDTVRRALKEAGLRAVKKVKKPKLTAKAKRERVAFARAHKHWTFGDWRRVLWSDKTKINWLGSDGMKWA